MIRRQTHFLFKRQIYALQTLQRLPRIQRRAFHEVEDSDQEDDVKKKQDKIRRYASNVFKAAGAVVGAVVACLCIGLGEMMDERYYHNEINDDTVFVEGSADHQMKTRLRAGDVIMFHRSLWSYNPLLMMKIGLHKLTTKGSGWTQVGVIAVDVDEEMEPYVIEHTWKGLKVTPYDMRIVTSQCDAISFRHLRTQFTLEQVTALSDFLQEYKQKAANGEGKHFSWWTFFWRVFMPAKSSVALQGERNYLEYNVREFNDQIEKTNNAYEKQDLLRKIKMVKTQITWFDKEIEMKQKEVKARETHYFRDCELVIEAWKVLGIVEPNTLTHEYLPRHFVADIYLPFTQLAYLDEPTCVRAVGSSTAALSATSGEQSKNYTDNRKAKTFIY